MIHRPLWVWLTVTTVLLSACSYDEVLRPNPFSDEVMAFNETAIEALAEETPEALMSLLSEEFLAIENVETGIEKIRASVRDHPVNFEYLTGEFRETENTDTPTQIYYSIWQTQYGGQYAILEIATEALPGCCQVRHLRVRYYDIDKAAEHDWGAAKIGPVRFGFIALAILIPIFIIVSFIACIRTPNVKRKWLWLFFIAFGLWGVSLNWTTGGLSLNFISWDVEGGSFRFSIIHMKLLGAGFDRQGVFYPWVIDIGIPLGAILFWIRRKKWLTGGEMAKRPPEVLDSDNPPNP